MTRHSCRRPWDGSRGGYQVIMAAILCMPRPAVRATMQRTGWWTAGSGPAAAVSFLLLPLRWVMDHEWNGVRRKGGRRRPWMAELNDRTGLCRDGAPPSCWRFVQLARTSSFRTSLTWRNEFFMIIPSMERKHPKHSNQPAYTSY
jgi:hypothetical protein